MGIRDRKAQDAFIFGLQKQGIADLSTRLLADNLTDEELEAGIPVSEISGDFFYMEINQQVAQEEQQPETEPEQMQDRQALEKERAQLLARLAEIDKLLAPGPEPTNVTEEQAPEPEPVVVTEVKPTKKAARKKTSAKKEPVVSRKEMIEALKPHKKQHPEIKLGGKGSTTEAITEWYNKYCR